MDVLITEDSSFMRMILKKILDDMDFDGIYEAESGEEALEIFKDKEPDLILLDIVMEGMDGIEVLEEIKNMDPDSKVLMISAVGQEQMKDQAFDLGAKAFIEKPFDSEGVKEKIKEVI